MMIEKSGSIELRDISIAEELTPELKEMAAGMVRVKHLYRSALKVAVTQMEILDEEFAGLYDHSPIHHIEHRIKTLESAAKKLKRRGYALTIDNIYAHIQDMAAHPYPKARKTTVGKAMQRMGNALDSALVTVTSMLH